MYYQHSAEAGWFLPTLSTCILLMQANHPDKDAYLTPEHEVRKRPGALNFCRFNIIFVVSHLRSAEVHIGI